ncbi:MAG TPA: hypothetical protein V6C85_07030 [Allocoleopsis sp.]
MGITRKKIKLYRVFFNSCLIVCLFSSPIISAAPTQTLFVHIEGKGDTFRIFAETTNQSQSYQIKSLQGIETIYSTLESRRIDRINFETLLKNLGEKLFEPIRLLIESSSEIQFIISEDLIKIPFDLLYFNDEPLFLQRPITYSFAKVENQNFKFSQSLSALILSDKTADPDNGTYVLKKILPSSDYYDARDLNLKKLESVPNKDLILISAHGMITFTDQDYIALEDEQIYPYHLSRMVPKLIYIDSCQLGVSNAFIQSFRNAGTTYYIAPITSNEAGNSSTKTIELFFRAFREGYNPSVALFIARKKLDKYFEKTNDLGLLLGRVFPFRLYQLR